MLVTLAEPAIGTLQEAAKLVDGDKAPYLSATLNQWTGQLQITIGEGRCFLAWSRVALCAGVPAMSDERVPLFQGWGWDWPAPPACCGARAARLLLRLLGPATETAVARCTNTDPEPPPSAASSTEPVLGSLLWHADQLQN